MTSDDDPIKKKRERERIRCALVKKKAIAYMGYKCHDCGGIFPDPVYDFHHLDPKDKERQPSYYFRKGIETTLKELSKCIMLCANCHRIRHWYKEENIDSSH